MLRLLLRSRVRCIASVVLCALVAACAGDKFRASSAGIAVVCSKDGAAPTDTCEEIDFGEVPIGQTATAKVTVSNPARSPLIFSGSGWNPIADAFMATTLPMSLSAAENVTMGFAFRPTEAGSVEAVYFIDSNAENAAHVEIRVKGKGIGPVSVEVSPKEIDFGDVVVNQSEIRPLTVKNTDTGPFEILSAEVVAGSPEFTLSTATQQVLEPGGSTTFTASYAPTTEGANSGTIELQMRRVGSTDVSVTTVTVPLGGRGVQPAWCAGAISKPLCDCGVQSTCAAGGGCQPARRVFLTRTMMNGDLQGVTHADAICQDYATKAALGGTWMAFIGDSASSPAKRFSLASVPYALIDGTIVANNGAGLTSGSLVNGISLDECGTLTENAEVWTGLSYASATSGSGCANFTSSSNAADYAKVGLSGRADSTWVNVYLQFCDRGNVRLYCVEQ